MPQAARLRSSLSVALPATFLGVVLFCCDLTDAADTREILDARLASELDRQAVDSLDFILSLGLSSRQARAILPPYEQACRLHLERYRKHAEILPLEIRAYSAFLAEDRLNQGFSPEVERETVQIHRRAIEANEEHTKKLNLLAGQVDEALSPAQLQIAGNYRPNRRAVLQAMSTPQERRKAARRQQKEERKALQQRRGRPVGRAPTDHALVGAQSELEAISRAVHPRPDNVARYLLTPAAAESLYELAGARPADVVREAVQVWRWGLPQYSRSAFEHDQQALHALRQEINNWNLVNGMYFDRVQIEKLVYLADQVSRLHSARDQADRKQRIDPLTFNAQVVRLELAAESVLRQGQRDVLRDYKPCLIPPKNLKDPVRVGQANDTDHLVRWLERARDKSNASLSRMIDRLIDGEAEHLGPLADREEAERKRLLAETARQAAGMSDVEFALNKDDLAEAIQPRDRKVELIDAIDGMRRQRLLPGRTSRFLLNEGFAQVLTMRYAQLASGASTVKTAAARR